MFTNNIHAGLGLKGQTLLIAEIFPESIDGGVMGKGAHTGSLNKSLWLQKTQNCIHLAPGQPQSLLSNGICTSGNISKTFLQA